MCSVVTKNEKFWFKVDDELISNLLLKFSFGMKYETLEEVYLCDYNEYLKDQNLTNVKELPPINDTNYLNYIQNLIEVYRKELIKKNITFSEKLYKFAKDSKLTINDIKSVWLDRKEILVLKPDKYDKITLLTYENEEFVVGEFLAIIGVKSTKMLPVLLHKYQIEFEEIIGQGAFGKIVKVKDHSDIVAKITKHGQGHVDDMTDIIRELPVLIALKGSKNIVELIGHSYDENMTPIIFFKYYEYSLYNIYLKEEDYPGFLPLDFAKTSMFQILNGLQELENMDIVHRDIKPQNILVDPSTWKLVIADLGSSRRTSKDNISTTKSDFRNVTSTCGMTTLWYSSPEVLASSENKLPCKIDTSSDLWSAGIIMCELLSQGFSPIMGKTDKEQLSHIRYYFGFGLIIPEVQIYSDVGKGLEEMLPEIICPVELDLIDKLLKIDRTKRISVSDALKHQYFNEITSIVTKESPETIIERIDNSSKNIEVSLESATPRIESQDLKKWKKAVAYLYEISSEYAFMYKEETVHFALSILYKFSILINIENDYKLAVYSSMYIASMALQHKHEVTAFYTVMDPMSSKKKDALLVEIIAYTKLILEAFNYDIYKPTSYDYVVGICKELENQGVENTNIIFTNSLAEIKEKFYELKFENLSIKEIAFDAVLTSIKKIGGDVLKITKIVSKLQK
jgi:serine/threonine protein kinase